MKVFVAPGPCVLGVAVKTIRFLLLLIPFLLLMAIFLLLLFLSLLTVFLLILRMVAW